MSEQEPAGMSTQSGTSDVAPDPLTGGSSTAPRYGPVGYGGYTGVSDGAGFTGHSTPEFEDTSPASTSVITVGLELITSLTPIGPYLHGAIMAGGVVLDIYEMAEDVSHRPH